MSLDFLKCFSLPPYLSLSPPLSLSKTKKKEKPNTRHTLYCAVLSCFVHFLKSKVQGGGDRKIQFERKRSNLSVQGLEKPLGGMEAKRPVGLSYFLPFFLCVPLHGQWEGVRGWWMRKWVGGGFTFLGSVVARPSWIRTIVRKLIHLLDQNGTRRV